MADPLTVVKSEPLAAPLRLVQSVPSEGYWEDLPGHQGRRWHPPGVPEGADPTANRADSAIISGSEHGEITPEMILGGVSALRNVSDAVRGTVGLAQRSVAGIKAALPQVTPIVKYEVTKAALQKLGLPNSVAVVVAAGVSGYSRGGIKVPTTAADTELPAAVETVPAEAGAVAQTAPAVASPAPEMAAQPTAPTTKPLAFNPSQALTTARETFAKLGQTAQPGEVSNTMELIRRGTAPEDAVAIVLRNRGGGAMPKLPTAFTGLPTDDAMLEAVAQRNKTGRWSR